MKPIRVMTIFGTRPEAIKMAPLALELPAPPGHRGPVLRHRPAPADAGLVLDIFRLKPDYDLNIMEPRQTLSTITSKCLLGMEEVLEQAKPDLVLVHGDTSTTFAGALAAFYHQITVGHVEAGLRTWDKYSPFPEEMNRTLVGDIADLHFCPTAANRDNLAREGITRGRVSHGQYGDRRPPDHRRKDYPFSTPCSTSWTMRGKSHPGDLPPAGELRRAHGPHHDRPAPHRRRLPGGGAGLPGPPVPGGAGGGGASICPAIPASTSSTRWTWRRCTT